MKITIIVFSPSGNTLKVGKSLKKVLCEMGAQVQLLNLTRKSPVFTKEYIDKYFQENVHEHDLLCVGGPVYAHHLHYNVTNFIRNMPYPKNGWGRLAVPFITWGGINSGIALWEAAESLKKSGRLVVSGMKINSFHCLTKLKQIKIKVNEGLPGPEALPTIKEFGRRIMSFEHKKNDRKMDVGRKLDYQGQKVRIKAKTVFREKFWQKFIYPKIIFVPDKCTQCGICVKICSVQRIALNSQGIHFPKNKPDCIHCARCIASCPSGALDFKTDWSKWNRLLGKAAAGKGLLPSNESPKSAVYPIEFSNS